MKDKKKLIIATSVILGVLVLTLGITYAVFTYNRTGETSELVLGDIWMKYTENNQLTLSDAMPQKLIANDFVTSGYLNPIMKEQNLIETNELTMCVNYFEDVEFDEGSTAESYCKGETVSWNGYSRSFQHDLDYGAYDDIQLQEMESLKIIVSVYYGDEVNSVMKSQSLMEANETNELSLCMYVLSDYELLEGESYENFCRGTGRIQGLTYNEHRDTLTDLYSNTYSSLLSNNIIVGKNILLETNLPYFEFTIDGKNTYNDKDIQYEIVLNNSEYNGEDKETRTERIQDKFLKFALVEIVGENTHLEFYNRSYEDLTNTTIFTDSISSSDGEITRTYRLYMWIGDEVVIGGGDATYDYDMKTWNEKIYASVRVDVNGDFVEKNLTEEYVPATDIPSFKRLVNNNFQDTVIVDTDGTVYLSGTNEEVNYNYVWYSGKLWRITAISPDGTVKMITDSAITTITYGSDYNFYTDENNTSYMYQWLNEDFLDTLYNYENIIVTDATWNASPGDGDVSSKLPIEGQNEVFVNTTVGLLNSYEYYKSYQNTSSGSGYLNIGYYWWLLNRANPSSYTGSSNVWLVNYNGYDSSSRPSGAYGVRPVINLKSTIQLEGGSGTASDPYRIKGDKEEVVSGTTLINTRTSGEYVNFNEELYRIVGNENETTKLIKADYIKDSTTTLSKKFASTITFGEDTNTQTDDYFDYYLNNTWKSAIEDNYEEMLVEGTYYIKLFSSGNYKETVCMAVSNTTTIEECEKTTSTWSGFVGLPRYGEMFASQTRDRTYNNAQDMWLITPYSSSSVWAVNWRGEGNDENPEWSHDVRPTIHLKDTIVIKSGEGTKDKPFVVGLS